MTTFYINIAGLDGDRFETYAAIQAGNAVRTELRDSAAARRGK